MRIENCVLGFVFAVCTVVCLGAASNEAQAHTIFKKEIEAALQGLKFDCNACHVDKKAKTERNSFGMLFYKQLEAQELSKNWKSKKGVDKKDYEEKVMIPAFKEASKKVMSMTIEDVIKAGLFDGIKVSALNIENDIVNKAAFNADGLSELAAVENRTMLLRFAALSSSARKSVESKLLADRMFASIQRRFGQYLPSGG